MSQAERSARFEALGATAVVLVAEAEGLAAATDAVRETVAVFDEACSRFRDDSELMAVNRAAGTSVQVSPLLAEAISAALRGASLTDGDVDPTVGEALLAIGYDMDFAAIEASPQRGRGRSVTFAAVPGWRTVAFDSATRTIRTAAGVQLDLGATAKALAADHAAAAAGAAARCGVLVSLGGDVAIAGPAPSDGWIVRVTDDHRSGPEAPGQWITLRSGGLATSSTTVRRWKSTTGPVHHLVDPQTGESADSVWRTVSTTAASCLDANIASTAAIIRSERAIPWLESLGLPSRLVGADGNVRHIAGWPTSGDDLS